MRRKAVKLLTLFLIGGLAYYFLEILWRGYSHWSMFILGGAVFVEVGFINEFLSWDTSLIKQGLIGAVIITVSEFIAGVILNICLLMNVWDYSHLPFNIFGQVCLLYSLVWFILSIAAIIIDDYLRYFLFSEEYPCYKVL